MNSAGYGYLMKGRKDMLVLTRTMGEQIYIGDDICITIVEVDRNKIRVGIEAPVEVPIYRREVMTLAQVEERRKTIEGNKASGRREREKANLG